MTTAFALAISILVPGLQSAPGGSPSPGARADSPSAASGQPSVLVLEVRGAISPVTTNYLTRGLERARVDGATAVLVQLDTPGGLLESTQNIVQAILGSGVPVVVYVAPDGARAASAGTFITLSAHVAAMAPSTTIGAASPVQMGPGGGGGQDTVMQTKLFEYAESFIQSIAERRGRNAEWAVSAVREGESATATEAVELGVVDLVAPDREALLQAIDGRVVEDDTLRTAGAEVTELPRNLAERTMQFITRPEVMLILMMVAIYGIVGEVTNPGAIVPGVAGAISLVLLLWASAAMPINVAGYALVGLAIVLFVAEAFTPTFGLLLAGGAVSFFLGSLLLFQELPEPMQLSWAWLVPATVLTALFFLWIVTAGIRVQLAGPKTGAETMIGRRAEVVDRVGPEGGRVFVNGEYWSAVSEEEIAEGDACEIEALDGLTMRVKPLDTAEET